jgi:putative flippase GtrA
MTPDVEALAVTESDGSPEGGKFSLWLLHLWVEGRRYFMLSLAALIVDYSVFFLCLRAFDLDYLISNSFGFVVGLIITYIGSIVWVFSARRLRSNRLEFTIFAALGVAALAVNSGVLAIGVEWLRLAPEYAKFGAAGGSFLFSFFTRKFLLFA